MFRHPHTTQNDDAFKRKIFLVFLFFIFFLPYLSSIFEKAMYRYVLDGESALAWELPFLGHLSST